MRWLVCLLLLCLNVSAVAAPPENQLKDHPSPYLAMHGEDPVRWQLWGREAVERARREDKLIYVSIGYFSCHWCHVMQRESYSDPGIAELLNRDFIPVKVDRELQPALDARLIEFVERTRGYSGWPLNVFLTPRGYPLVGVVYLPPEQFRGLLVDVQQRWDRQRPELRDLARRAAEQLAGGERSPGPDLAPGLADKYRAALVRRALEYADPLDGGFFGPNKFPMAPQLRALLEAVARHPHEELDRFLRLTLDRMADRGLRDQLRGGFFRYVVDPDWQTPHFEKMLYDNALLAELYVRASRVLGEPRYETVARDTLAFMLRELRAPSGTLVASLSAVDGQGVEGGFYLWDEAALRRLLSPPLFQAASLAWGMTAPAPSGHGHLPVQAMTAAQVAGELGLEADEVRRRLSAARRALVQAQEARTLPRDRKLLAGWNGLALRAFSVAARRLNDRGYRAAAERIRAYLIAELWDGRRLLRARTGGGSLGVASLEDYAYVAAGLLEWARLTGRPEDFAAARAVAEQGWARYHTATGWKIAEEPLIRYAAAEAVLADGPMPSPSALLVEVTLGLAGRDGDAARRKQALSALNVGHEALASEPFWFATQIRVLARAQSAREAQ